MQEETVRWSLKVGVVSLGVLAVGAGIIGCPPACTVSGTANDDVLVGTNGDDVICGFGGNDQLYGLDGNDVLRGGAGNDLLDGGGGNDWADYSDSPSGVAVNLVAGTAGPWFFGAGHGNDTLTSIRRVQGSSYTDSIIGDDNDNVLNGGAGNDFIWGGTGEDTLRGDAGNDSLFGENGPDHLFGGDGDDFLQGGRGDDELAGGPGSDWASYATAPEAVGVFSGGSLGGDGDDTFAGLENFEGSEFDDYMYLPPAVPETLRGLGGDDIITGDSSTTTIDYSKSLAGVLVDLVAGGAWGEGEDTLAGIKHITGSSFADVLHGNNQKNTILGGGGNDQLFGKANDDLLDGQGGNDSADGGADQDTCTAETETNCEL